MNTEQNTQHFKKLLEEEKAQLESNLAVLTQTDGDRDRADEAEVADDIGQQDINSAEARQFETKLVDVVSALEKIDAGTYGVCEVGGEEIEEDVLNANPSSRTCKAHMEA